MRSWSHAQQCFPLINFSLKVKEERRQGTMGAKLTTNWFLVKSQKRRVKLLFRFFPCRQRTTSHFKPFSELTRSSTRLIFLSGGPAWRLRLFRCTAHGNRSAILANVSPQKEEKISLVRQVVFPSGVQPSPFFPWGNVHGTRVTQA